MLVGVLQPLLPVSSVFGCALCYYIFDAEMNYNLHIPTTVNLW